MRRASVCVLLSAALHAALLSFVSMPTRAPMVEPSSIRVSLHGALPSQTESAAQADDAPAQKNTAPAQTETTPVQTDTPPIQKPAAPARPRREPTREQARPKDAPQQRREPAQKNVSSQTDAPQQQSITSQQGASHSEMASAPQSAPAAPSGVGARAIAELPDVSVTKRVQPDYPAPSRRRRDEGTVVIVARVDGGRVVSLSVERSSGHAALDEAALRAARGWRFSEASPFAVRMPFTFKIR